MNAPLLLELDATSITIQWDKATGRRGYRVRFRREDDLEWSPISTTTEVISGEAIKKKNLLTAVAYVFSVQSVGVGDSEWSPTSAPLVTREPSFALDAGAVVAHLESIWHSVNDTMTGTILRDEFVQGTELVLPMQVGFRHNKDSAPKTFRCFLETAATNSMPIDRLEQWYTRYKLIHSCSTLCCLFERYAIRQLAKRGILRLCSSGAGESVELSTLKTWGIFFRQPDKQYTLQFNMLKTVPGVQNPHNRTVEGSQMNRICTHNVLVSSTTGHVLDLCGGQFTGNIHQRVLYASREAYIASGTIPGEILAFNPSPSAEIEEQLASDVAASEGYGKGLLRPERHPMAIAQSFAASAAASTNIWDGLCRHCFGTAYHAPLLLCSTCKTVAYCGRSCQKRDWKSHKLTCSSVKEVK